MMRLLSFLICSFLLVTTSCDNGSVKVNLQNTAENSQTISDIPSKLLRHVVLFKFSEAANKGTVTKIEEAFVALQEQIPEIHSFEWGINNSPEGLDKGLTHCFFLTFLSEADREIYLPHPEHKKFVELIGPYIEDVTVVDYWTK